MIRGKTLDDATAVIWFFHSEPWRKLKIQCPRPSFSVGIVLRSSAKSFTMHFTVFICISLLKSESWNSVFMLFNWYCCIFFYENLYNAILLFVSPLSEDFYACSVEEIKAILWHMQEYLASFRWWGLGEIFVFWFWSLVPLNLWLAN